MELLLILIIAHLVTDFYVKPGLFQNSPEDDKKSPQTNESDNKNQSIRYVLKLHCTNAMNSLGIPSKYREPSLVVLKSLILLATYIGIVLASLEIKQIQYSDHLFFIFFGYVLINGLIELLCRFYRKITGNSYKFSLFEAPNLPMLLVIQACHILVIFTSWLFISNHSYTTLLQFINGLVTAKSLVIAMAYLLVCKPASLFISLALKTQTKSVTTESEPSPVNYTLQIAADKKSQIAEIKTTATPAPTKSETNQSKSKPQTGLVFAGTLIGYIERCLALSFILIGQFTGIGFLVATKTIFRFGDLTKSKDRELTEYMMLGTLLSFATAFFVGWVTNLLLKHI